MAASAFGTIQQPSTTRKRKSFHDSPDTVTAPILDDVPELVLPAAATRRLGIRNTTARTCYFLCAIVSFTLLSLAIDSLVLAPMDLAFRPYLAGSTPLFLLEVFMDSFFLLDVVLNFFTT